MMRWIVRSSLRLRLVMAGLAVLLMIFGFTRLRHAPVDVLPRQVGISAPLRPEFSRPYVESQAAALGLSAQKVEALIDTRLEADLVDDEVSCNEKEIGGRMSSKAPSRNPVGLCPERGGMLIAVQDFSSRAMPLRI